MLPIISVVGKSNSGKTTFIEKLIPELKGRGYRVATVKHDAHEFQIDHEGKDTWRHARAGAEAVIISSPRRYAIIKNVTEEKTIHQLAHMVGEGVDIVVTEGYKKSRTPKVEVHRPEVHPDLLCNEEEDDLIAVASNVKLDVGVPSFDINDVKGVADLIEERFLKGRESDKVELLSDGHPLPLSLLEQNFISRALRGMLSALNGVEEASEITLRLHE